MKKLLIIILLFASCSVPTAPDLNFRSAPGDDLGPTINAVVLVNQYNCMSVSINSMNTEEGYTTVDVDVELTNPLAVMTGHNVRLILMCSAEPSVFDGYTDLWNPISYPIEGLYGYTPGIMANYTPTTILNSYIDFGSIGPGESVTRNFTMTYDAPLQIAYAIAVDTRPPPSGWVLTRFGDVFNSTNGVCTDHDGSIYVTGQDPNHSADAYIRKYNQVGDILWERFWSDPWAVGWDVVASGEVLTSTWYWKDGDLNTWLTTDEWNIDGTFMGTIVTTDGTYPTSGQTVITSCVDDEGSVIEIEGDTIRKVGEWERMLESDGNWPVRFTSVCTDGSNIFATGNWRSGTCNFDPCGDGEWHTATQTWDFLIKYEEDGCW